MEPVDNRQLPSRLWAPGSGQACRKILGFALIPNCELKFGPVHNASGTCCTKEWPPSPLALAFLPARHAPTTHTKTALSGGLLGHGVPAWVFLSDFESPGLTETWPFSSRRTAELVGPSPAVKSDGVYWKKKDGQLLSIFTEDGAGMQA